MTTVQNLSMEELEAEREILQVRLADSEKKIVHLEEQLNWFKRQLFGKWWRTRGVPCRCLSARVRRL